MPSTSSKRPYFNKNIEEISALVQENRENKKVLKQILHELTFHSRPKAKALAKTVGALLEDGATPEQLSLPLEAPAPKAPLEELSPTANESNLEESPEGEAPKDEPTPETEVASPPLVESLWDKLVHWFKAH